MRTSVASILAGLAVGAIALINPADASVTRCYSQLTVEVVDFEEGGEVFNAGDRGCHRYTSGFAANHPRNTFDISTLTEAEVADIERRFNEGMDQIHYLFGTRSAAVPTEAERQALIDAMNAAQAHYEVDHGWLQTLNPRPLDELNRLRSEWFDADGNVRPGVDPHEASKLLIESIAANHGFRLDTWEGEQRVFVANQSVPLPSPAELQVRGAVPGHFFEGDVEARVLAANPHLSASDIKATVVTSTGADGQRWSTVSVAVANDGVRYTYRLDASGALTHASAAQANLCATGGCIPTPVIG